MSFPDNKSKPRYSPLEPDLGGRYHLLFGQGSGGEALLRLVARMPQDAQIHLIYASESVRGRDWSDALRMTGLRDICIVRTRAEAIAELDGVLSKCWMGTRLYIAGSESFIGDAVQLALKYNLNSDEVQREHCGSAARRVYCVHCGTSHENVRTNLVECAGRGVQLLVRDHYSRRLAAYMGVMADAELPGILPPLRTVSEWGLHVKHAETIPVVVTAAEQVTPLIRQFTLSPIGSAALPPFSGGSHIIVILRRGDRTFRNSYSLMRSPRDFSHYTIAVRRHDGGRGGSLFLHEHVQVGAQLEISQPVNLFPLAMLGRKHVFVAGGVGITPILAMIHDVIERRLPWELHYSARGLGNDPFGLRLLERDGSLVHLHDSESGTRLDFDQILKQPLGTHVYTCGPPAMIDAVRSTAKRMGWPDSHIHSELFSVPPVGRPFEVFLARSGMTVHVPAERSLLEAIEAAGVDAPYLCRGGACGECETDVLELEGELIHNDDWLSDEEKASGKKIMPCVSRATCSRLVLER